MEKCEDIRHTLGMGELYKKRKETIERLFGSAKENQGEANGFPGSHDPSAAYSVFIQKLQYRIHPQ